MSSTNYGFPAPPPLMPTSPAALGTSPANVSASGFGNTSGLGALGVAPPATNKNANGCLPPGTPPPNCGSTKRWDDNSCTCVDSGFNNAPPPGTTPPPTPPPATGTCPDGTPDGYNACCPDGPRGQRVWRSDTKTCEYEDDRQKAGQDTCRGTPITCPPGQTAWCDFTTAQFRCAIDPSAGSGGGGGGGGNSGGAKAPAYTGSSQSTDFNALLGKQYTDLLNAPSRYTPEALQALYGQITAQSAGAIARGQRDVSAQAAQRGMSRAGSTEALLKGVRDTAEQQRGAADVNVMVQKITADHQDKLDALDRAQKYLDSMRDNEYRYTLVGEQARQFNANLTLAYANLAQQRSLLTMQLQSQWDMLQSQQGFSLLLNGT